MAIIDKGEKGGPWYEVGEYVSGRSSAQLDDKPSQVVLSQKVQVRSLTFLASQDALEVMRVTHSLSH